MSSPTKEALANWRKLLLTGDRQSKRPLASRGIETAYFRHVTGADPGSRAEVDPGQRTRWKGHFALLGRNGSQATGPLSAVIKKIVAFRPVVLSHNAWLRDW